MNIHIVILAAGKGTRMKSARPKVLHHVAGRPLIDYVLSTAATLNPCTTTVVVGHQAADLQSALEHHRHVSFVVQEPQLGTAHALMATEPVFQAIKDDNPEIVTESRGYREPVCFHTDINRTRK